MNRRNRSFPFVSKPWLFGVTALWGQVAFSHSEKMTKARYGSSKLVAELSLGPVYWPNFS